MAIARDALTPDALSMLDAIAKAGSFAAAARQMNLVPSALTYRVRQVEDALDVLLFDRRSRQAQLTPAGQELLREGQRLLADMDAIANRIHRFATGWESQLTIAVDSVIDNDCMLDLCTAFFEQNPPTRLKLRHEALNGTWQALTSGLADLAIGVVSPGSTHAGIDIQPLGQFPFVFAMAPQHPLAALPEPLSDLDIAHHRAVAVADSVVHGHDLTFGLLAGQDVFTVPSMATKLQAQLRGLGVGFLPTAMAAPHVAQGSLVVREVQRPNRSAMGSYAWRQPSKGKANNMGRALQWWLSKLEQPHTRKALQNQL